MILILSNNLGSIQQTVGYESANKMTQNLLQMHEQSCTYRESRARFPVSPERHYVKPKRAR